MCKSELCVYPLSNCSEVVLVSLSHTLHYFICFIAMLATWKTASPVSPESLYLLPSMVQILPPSPTSPLPSGLSFRWHSAVTFLKGRADCWRRTVWALAVSPHTHTHKNRETHTHTSAGTQVLTQQIKRIVALPPAASPPSSVEGVESHWGFFFVAPHEGSGHQEFEKFPGSVKVTLSSLTEKSVVP